MYMLPTNASVTYDIKTPERETKITRVYQNCVTYNTRRFSNQEMMLKKKMFKHNQNNSGYFCIPCSIKLIQFYEKLSIYQRELFTKAFEGLLVNYK
jgi:hypothetical protein